MNYALVENGTVVNIIWLNERNEAEWPNAVRLGERMVEVGDTYEDGRWFYRDGTEVLTAAEAAQQEAAQYAAALQVMGVEVLE